MHIYGYLIKLSISTVLKFYNERLLWNISKDDEEFS